MNSLARPLEASLLTKTAARELGRGGTTLWKHESNGYSVIVFQAHDEPPAEWNLDEDNWDMIELRVISARTDLAHFWDRTSKRVTHWKASWTLYNMIPGKTVDDLKPEVKGIRYPWWHFDKYEEAVDKAIGSAEKAVKSLDALKNKTAGSFKPWAVGLKFDAGGPEKDKFWACAVYPDGFHWVVKIHRGMLKSFGKIYPRSWEQGYRFDKYRKADNFAKNKMRRQMREGFAEITDPKTLRVLKWSLREAKEADEADKSSGSTS